MTHMVTRCPKCATAFRVTTTQLESAKGSVRCGSCLHIFKAENDLVKKNPVIDTTATPPEAITDSVEIDDDTLINDDMDQPKTNADSYEFEGYLDSDSKPKPTVSLFERKIDVTPELETEAVDESWAETLLAPSDDGDPAPAKTPSPSPVTEKLAGQLNAAALLQRHAIEVPDEKDYAQINQQFSSLYKEPVFSIINEDATDLGEPADTTPISATKNESDEVHNSEFTPGFFRSNEEPQPAAAPKHPLKSQSTVHSKQDSRATLLKNIAPSPIELTAQRLRRWWQRPHWLSLSIVAVIILLGQIAYFKFDYFSRVQPYRTAYLFVCPLINCTLPSLVDPSKITPYQLIIRNHPSAEQALVIDVMLRNDAGFAQPYPDLILEFTNLDDKPVASRRFTPAEYLAGEVAGKKYIPSNQPVHVALELSHPGPDAVNYHMSIAH